MYKKDLALNNLQSLICQKTQPTNQIITFYKQFEIYKKNIKRVYEVQNLEYFIGNSDVKMGILLSKFRLPGYIYF